MGADEGLGLDLDFNKGGSGCWATAYPIKINQITFVIKVMWHCLGVSTLNAAPWFIILRDDPSDLNPLTGHSNALEYCEQNALKV